MNAIWANRLVAGTKTWEEVPASRRAGVQEELESRVDSGEITQARMEAIMGGGTA